MPIPKHFSTWRKVKAWLTWATIEQACGDVPLHWYQRLARKVFSAQAPHRRDRE